MSPGAGWGAGSVEATALGSIMEQDVATGLLADIQAGCRAVGPSVGLTAFVPALTPGYEEAFDHLEQLVGPPWSSERRVEIQREGTPVRKVSNDSS